MRYWRGILVRVARRQPEHDLRTLFSAGSVFAYAAQGRGPEDEAGLRFEV
jgi:hypothetical protein